MWIVRLIVLLVLVVLVVESTLLYRITRRSPGSPSFASLLPNLAAGALLVLAVAAATLPEPAGPVALCLLLGGLAHAWDLRQRLLKR